MTQSSIIISGACTIWLVMFALSVTAAAGDRKVTIGGAPSLAPLAEQFSAQFRKNHPETEIEIRRATSNYAVNGVRTGAIQIGLVTRNLDSTEKLRLKIATLGHDPITILSYPWNPVANLSLEQLRQIYLGKITSWKTVGGEDQGIVVLTREASASLHKIFLETLFGRGFDGHEKAFILRANKDKVLRTIKRVRGSLGYGIVRPEEAQAEGVTVMALDGRSPSAANLRQAIYPLVRPQFAVAKAKTDDIVREWMSGFEEFAKRQFQQGNRNAEPAS
jgi:phosphate transport system substrate-binding protein